MTTGVATVKIRIGYGLGVNSLTNDEERFGHFVDELERLFAIAIQIAPDRLSITERATTTETAVTAP